MSVLDFLASELVELERRHRLRVPRVVRGRQGTRIVLDGREVVSFSSNDYLGLAGHPALAEAAHQTIDRAGVGAGASRLIVGNEEAHVALEAVLADLFRCESAVLFNSGYAANTGLLPVLAGPGDEVFSDELNHASIIDGCRLSRAVVRVYPHRDLAVLDGLLESSKARRRIVVTESLFSMDGDRADLAALSTLSRNAGAVLVVDEAHAAGILGPRGGGLLEALDLQADALVGTLGKSFGSAGACVAGCRALGSVLWNLARPLVFSTAMPAMVAASAAAAVRLAMGSEGAARRRTLWARVAELAHGLRDLQLQVSGESPIVPLVVGGDPEVMRWTEHLLERGLFVQGIRPPTVPEGTARLRIALSAGHEGADIASLLNAIEEGMAAGLPLSRGTAE